MNNSIIQTFEELSFNAWPAIRTKFYDGWILRFANGYTKRANSINPIYQSTIKLQEKIDFCEKLYNSQNLPTIFKIARCRQSAKLDRELEKRGYLFLDEGSVKVLDMGSYKYQKPIDTIVESEFNENWINGFINCSNIEDEVYKKSLKKILHNIVGEVVVVSKEVDGKIVGCGYGAIEREYIGIFDIVVDKKYRGKGFGTDIMNAVLANAVDRKIKYAYLLVISGNVPAENLYEKLGFKEIYRYWYRKKGS